MKNSKELEEISTTDKLKAFKALKEAGFRVELNNNSVPTVICDSAEDIEKQKKNVMKVVKEIRYTGSYGRRGPRKGDLLDVDTF